jgi:hypothetical protein
MITIGVDLDNTLVCYDGLFHAEALSRGLIPANLRRDKSSVRDHLRAQGREDAWTELQGHVYGPAMSQARPFPGAKEFVARAKERGWRVAIISHRTAKPILGPAHDLHASARAWLTLNGFDVEVFLEPTKEKKLARIAAERCDDFIDDLPEFLGEPAFPSGVRRWLFGAGEPAAFPRLPTWPNASELFFPDAPVGAQALLARAGLKDAQIRLLPGAANNRVFLAEDASQRVVLKQYFRHKDDPRDRLSAEWSFSRFAWDRGLRELPQPLEADEKAGLAVYGYLDGRKPAAQDLDEGALEKSLGFLKRLNAGRGKAGKLPPASEACFSIAAHLETVERRVGRLLNVEGVGRELSAAWTEVKRRTLARAKEEGLSVSRELLPGERVISPSDFGFHNALVTKSGLAFLDFEYAGWDDPAKLVCDFFCQQAVPVPAAWRDSFSKTVAALGGRSEEALARMSLLRPVYELKWCCILLNEFLPAGKARRDFAAAPSVKEAQLAKAKRLLAGLAAA